jgi:hypothetical protein
VGPTCIASNARQRSADFGMMVWQHTFPPVSGKQTGCLKDAATAAGANRPAGKKYQ